MSKTQDFTACPNWGHGGRYVVDPATGERRPAADEAPPTPAEPATEALPVVESDAAAGTDKPLKKGK